jgi:import inner membrane translocase subunit TIM21
MKPTSSLLALRPSQSLQQQLQLLHTASPSVSSGAFIRSRTYATQTGLGTSPSPSTRRRKVTAFNDDGFVPWAELSAGEKAARATQQSFNFGLVIAGIVLTGGVTYFLWHDVFSPDSKTAHFNRAIDKIKDDARCVELLGSPKKIAAHGDETFNKWRRARPISSVERTDPDGTQHLLMHFYVEGPLNRGVARMHMVRPRNASELEYKYLYIDIKGHDRIYLEKSDGSSSNGRKALNFLGVKWG